ncbi:unnamed protein product [Echinostoma caproni]|uniref:EF-hand domain-containing protein n=1 Tax=Echinostoma caproni TaxID=27848 RepID=A0A183AFE8_9TREM|nr:unnamed protein product [Echinostoma caproni]
MLAKSSSTAAHPSSTDQTTIHTIAPTVNEQVNRRGSTEEYEIERKDSVVPNELGKTEEHIGESHELVDPMVNGQKIRTRRNRHHMSRNQSERVVGKWCENHAETDMSSVKCFTSAYADDRDSEERAKRNHMALQTEHMVLSFTSDLKASGVIDSQTLSEFCDDHDNGDRANEHHQLLKGECNAELILSVTRKCIE